MNHVIAGHPSPDPDCAVGMYATAAGLVLEGVPKSDISFHTLVREATWGGIRVSPDRAFEQVGNLRVYHVDCGGGALDHHHPDCAASSATQLVAQYFNLGLEWRPLVAQVTADDQGEWRKRGDVAFLARTLQGMWRQDKPLSVALAFTREFVEAQLANERARLTASRVKLQEYRSFDALPDFTGDEPLLASVPVEGFGRLGIVYSPDVELWPKLRQQTYHRKHGCEVVVAFAADLGITAVWTPQGSETLDLRDLGVVAAVRGAEAEMRGLAFNPDQLACFGNLGGMEWYAFRPTSKGRVISLLSGSPKVYTPRERLTQLSLRELAEIVTSQLASHSQEAVA